MYNKEMNSFREKILKNVSDKINNGDLNIQKNNFSDSNLSKENTEQKLQLYKDKLKENQSFFGGSIKQNLIKEDNTLFKKKDETTLIDTTKINNIPLNLSFCLDENYRDNFICQNVLQDQKFFFNSNLYRNLASLVLLNKEKNTVSLPINNLFMNKKDVLEEKFLKEQHFETYDDFENNIKELPFKHIYNNEQISFSNSLIDVLLFEINNNLKKNSTNTMVLDALKLNCIINVPEQLNESQMDNKIDITITNLQKKAGNNDSDSTSKLSDNCLREELKHFTINVKDYDTINNTINVLSKLYVVYDILLGNTKSNIFTKNTEGLLDIKKFIIERKNTHDFVPTLIKKLNLLSQHLNNFEKYINLETENTNKQVIVKKINKVKSLLKNILDNINASNIDLKISETLKLISKIQKNKNSYYQNFKSLKSVLDTISTVCDYKNKKEEKERKQKLSSVFDPLLKDKYVTVYKDYLKGAILQNFNKSIFFIPINFLITQNYKYNTCMALLLINKLDTQNVSATLYILKGDIDLNINSKVYETNIFYDYTLFNDNISKNVSNNIIELLKNLLITAFAGKNVKIELASCCNKRLSDLYSINEFVNELNKLELMTSNKEQLNLIKNEYFYLENFYQALYDISNLEFATPYSKISGSSKLSYKQHVEYLYQYDVLKHGNMKNKLDDLKSRIDLNNQNHVVNLFIKEIFGTSKLNFQKYKFFMKMINLYINRFIEKQIDLNKISIENINFLSDSFINKLLFSQNMVKNDFKMLSDYKEKLVKEEVKM